MWDGAYRLSQGLTPYSDFGLPIGPVSFYLPALFFYLFGATWLNLQLSQLLINFFLIISAWKLLNLLSSSKIEIYLGVFIFTINYIILLSHPWYNITAILLFLLSILLILYDKNYLDLLTGLLRLNSVVVPALLMNSRCVELHCYLIVPAVWQP